MNIVSPSFARLLLTFAVSMGKLNGQRRIKRRTSVWLGGDWHTAGRTRRHVQRDVDRHSELKHTRNTAQLMHTPGTSSNNQSHRSLDATDRLQLPLQQSKATFTAIVTATVNRMVSRGGIAHAPNE